VLDWQMPALDGVVTLQALRKINPRVRVLMTYDLSDEEDLAVRLREYRVDTLVKPFGVHDLLERLHRTLNRPSRA
jgi:DNA-binding response OmpR family regulator